MMKRFLLAGLLLWSVPLMAAEASEVVSVDSLLGDLTDLPRLSKLPVPAYTTKQFSSYDQASKSPDDEKAWFANGDAGQYLRVEEVNGRKEHVMMDIAGPGAIVRIWSANPKGVLRIYIDESKSPAIESPMGVILGGTMPGLPLPLAGERSRGWNLYFPIPYAKHCKVTSDEGGFYYHVNYRTYEPSARVTSFKPDDLRRLRHEIYDAAAKLTATRDEGGLPADRKKEPFDKTLAPEAQAELFKARGPRAICGILVRLAAKDLEAAARGTVLRISFDGEQTIECPVGDYYGTAPGLTPYASMPLGITAGPNQEMWSHWWMPFAREATVSVVNMGDQEVRIEGAVSSVPTTWDERSLLFHAGWRIERGIKPRPFTDWAHLECTGTGRFVGGHLHLQNTVRGWWGEGDEKIYVDGETFPSHFGTGTEDYYGYAWCSPERFVHAFHNQPRCDGPGNYGNTSVNRFHIIDDIPFTKSFKFDIENWQWDEKATNNRAAVSYWYARPGGKHFFKPLTKADVKLDVMPEFKIFTVAGAIEGEKLKVIDKTGGKTQNQDMGEQWSNAKHLWWTEGKPGDKLNLGFQVNEANTGRKHVIVGLTRAVDYGIVQLSINDQKAGEPIDLYNQNVAHTGQIDLGEFDLPKGQNKLTVEITGGNPKATAHLFGIDYLLLK